MPKYQAKITIESNSVPEVQQLSNLIQNTVDTIEHKDIIKLLEKVRQKPSLVKTALNFL